MLAKYVGIAGWAPSIVFIDTDFAERNGIRNAFPSKSKSYLL